MRNLTCLSAEKLLSISSPESLFSRSLSAAKQEYRALAKRWHPDNSTQPGEVSVFTHIVLLYREAQKKICHGNWDEPCEKAEMEVQGVKRFRLKNGSVKSVDYLTVRPFELGAMYIGDHHVTYELLSEFTDLFLNGRRQIRALSFHDDAMCLEMSRFLPQILETFQTRSANVLALRKTPDQLLLADVLKQHKQRIEPVEHVGWIMNVVWNICCYLEWSGLTHNAISPETIFISPLRHSGALLGGWWYAAPLGSQLTALPDRSMRFLPADILIDKTAAVRADLELAKALGRELLGDPSGKTIPADGSIASRLNDWLLEPSQGEARVDYREWKYKVLEDCFGKPEYVPMRLTSKDLYKEA